MSSVRWKEALFHDGAPTISLEDAIRTCTAFSGVHDFDFQNEINEVFADFTNWTGDAGATWDVSGSNLDATGGGGATWYQARHNTEVPPSFVASFDLVSGNGGFVFHGKTDASTQDGYLAWWSGSNCGFARMDAAGSGTNLIVMPYGISGPARIQVAVKWRLDSTDEDRKWLLMSLFVDGREFACFADDIGGTAYDWTNDFVGFAVTVSNNLVVDNLTVQELNGIIDYVSIDPSEAPAAGLSRAIGTTRLRMLGRYDGTMRVWKPGNRSADWSIDSDRPVQWADREERTRTLTHVRTIGALHAIDRFADDEGEAHMHRFSQTDDPNLMSAAEVYEEAGQLIADAKEQQMSGKLMMPLQALVEPWDVVTYASTDYRVLATAHQLSLAGRAAPKPMTQLEVRLYVAR